MPEGARITCEDTPCPEGWVCRPELGRCVRIAELDADPPHLVGEPVVEPGVAGQGTPVVLSFTVSEPLGADPVVTVAGRPAVRQGGEGRDHVYGYTPAGDEPEGPAAVTIRLVDTFGNLAEGLSGGTLVLDFTAPSVVPGSARIEPPVVREGVPVEVTFAVTEPLAGETVVRVGEAGLAEPAGEAVEDGTHRFGWSALGTEEEGRVAVRADLRDPAGNLRAGAEVGWLVLDFSEPVVTEARVAEGPLGPGDLAAADLTFDEPPAGEPRVRLVAGEQERTLQRVEVSPVASSFFYAVEAGDHGLWTVELDGLRDEAGNAADPQELGTVEVDAVAPEARGASVGPSPLMAGATLTARFESSEARRRRGGQRGPGAGSLADAWARPRRRTRPTGPPGAGLGRGPRPGRAVRRADRRRR